MGKITKKAIEKHKVSLSPALVDFIQKASTLPLAELRSHLLSLPTRWPFPRGDLYNWIEPLDRFDSILQEFNEKYGLNKGPQTQCFGNSILLGGSSGYTVSRLEEVGFGPDGDRDLVEVILSFSRLLLEKCGNRALYNSSDRLNDLLNTTSLSLLHSTLRITVFLALRYSERAPNVGQQPHSQFYSYDHDRLNKLASPLAPLSLLTPKRTLPSPSKFIKGKEKAAHPGKLRRSSTSVNPNDFKLLSKSGPKQDASGADPTLKSGQEQDWQRWANVKITWAAVNPNAETTDLPGEPSAQDPPTTPTPVRRQSSMLSRTMTSNSSTENTSSPNNISTSEKPGLQKIELSAADLSKTSIESILRDVPQDMPQNVRYELLHKLRVAYGLMTPWSRKTLLIIRLLAIAVLAYIYDSNEFPQKVFGTDANPSARSQLIQQIVSLVQTNKGSEDVSLYLQTLAMECLGVLARQKSLTNEINIALAPNSSHGLLLSLTQRGLADLQHDGDASDDEIGDDWREAIFSLMSVFMLHGHGQSHGSRTSEPIVHPSLISTYASGLTIITDKSLRVHLRILDFMKTFFHNFKDGLAVLSSNHAFEAVCELLGKLGPSALDLLRQGHGMPEEFKTKVTDYQISYMHQQVIRSMIDLINDIIGHQGGHAERILRNLVDSQSLLNAFRLILSNIEAFGAHTWSEVVKAIVGFLHNEPTNYTIITEAGITKILLDMVGPSAEEHDSDTDKTLTDNPERHTLMIPANADAIVNLSQAFGAICLTSAGFENFKSSGAVDRFFEIFQSPPHVKVIKDSNTLAMLGSTFDELVRHHTALKNSVISSIITMMARVRYICRSMAWQVGAGSKLWLNGTGNAATVAGGAEALIDDFVARYSSPSQTFKPITLPNGKKLLFSPLEDTCDSSIAKSAKDNDSEGLTQADYARPAISFLLNFFENQTMCSFFMEQGATDIVLDFVTLPSILPDDQTFGREGIMHEVASLVHMMAETKPHLVVPVLVDRARIISQEVFDQFSTKQPATWDCYFDAFVKKQEDVENMDIDKPSIPDTITAGTRIVKGLTSVFALATVLGETFSLPIYGNRQTNTAPLFLQVNVADIVAEVCRKLGSIAAACYREEVALQRAIPESWLAATRPGGFSTGDEEVDKLLSVQESPSEPAVADSVGDGQPNAPNSDNFKNDKQSLVFRNVQILRYLLIETPASISELLQRLGRSLVMKRRMDAWAKHKSNMVAHAIADAYNSQLNPYFMSVADKVNEDHTIKEARFAYLLIALAYIRSSLHDDSPNHGPGQARQALVIDHFRKTGGLKNLTDIGNELFDELKSCKVAKPMFSANTGLKHCLDILDDLTSFQNICESCHGVWMKEGPNKPYPFNPAQLLLELRMEALSLTRRIWDSDYADQASADVVQKLVSILKHVFSGDSESEAVQTSTNYPQFPSPPKKKFPVNNETVTRLASEKECSEDLVREALFRSNFTSSSPTRVVEEYCDAVKDNPRRRNLSAPESEIEISSARPDSDVRNSGSTPLTHVPGLLPNIVMEGGIEATLAEVVSSIADNDMDDDDDEDDDNEDDHGDATVDVSTGTSENVSSAMDINNILNRPETEPAPAETSTKREVTESQVPLFTVETIDAERESIREELADRCNNILNNHQNLTFELSELITSATKKLSDDARKTYWENTSDLLMQALLSRQAEEEMSESEGKKIAAAAHLIGLLIQDDDVFKITLTSFQEHFDGLMEFLRLPPITTRNPEDSSSPWVAKVLLILERMLSLDAEPAEVKWNHPTDLEPSSPPRLTYTSVFDIKQKRDLFELLVSILPRVGKDKSMGLSIIRVLVILTRVREIAILQGQRGNLQRLFLMIKQLGSGATGRLQNSFMLILRHIIEDDDTIKQIMRSEITANFLGRSSNRPPDLNAFIRDNYHLALRSPEIFAEISNEKIKLAGWTHQTSASALALRDIKEGKPTSEEKQLNKADTASTSQDPAASIETGKEDQDDADKTKTQEIKPPVVEHPDGVIHFLLSELLAYKDVEDKEPSKPNENHSPDSGDRQDSQSQDAQVPDTPVNGTATPTEKQDKLKFKADDHPIFLYRCFLLHCLTELLYSYNRTKIEFINFSRKADPMAVTPSKPRSGILNYLLNALVASGYVDKDDTNTCKKMMVLSDWATKVIVALCTKTGEIAVTGAAQRLPSLVQVDDQDNEPDLTFVRRFVLEHAIKAFRDATTSSEPLQSKYSRLLCFANLFRRLLIRPAGPDGAAGSHNNSYRMLGRMMFEKNLISVLTSSLAEIDLSFPSAKRVIKFILRPLQELTTMAVQLSIHSPGTISSAVGNELEDNISSASSVSDIDDEREETPDLFRNSALGMLDPSRHDESDTSEDDDEDDEEMYDEDYDEEMDYEDGLPAPNDGEVVSDEEIEEGMEDVGPIEGISGDVPMDIEFIVNGPHDVNSDEEDDDDDDDSDSDDDDDENEDFDIEIDDDEGEINADDENNSQGDGHEDDGEWEDEDEDEDDVQVLDDEVEGDVTFDGEDLAMPLDLAATGGTHAELNNLLRVLGEQDLEGHSMPPPPQLIVQDEHSEHDHDDDEDDEGDDDDDIDENDGMDYDDGFNFVGDMPDNFQVDGGQWDAWGEPPPTLFRRHRQPIPMGRHGMPSFMNRRVHALGDYHDMSHQIIGRHHRHPPQPRSGADDGINPLLQRSESNRIPRSGIDASSPFNFQSESMPFSAFGRGAGASSVITLPFPMDVNMNLDPSNLTSHGTHGAILDTIIQALQRGDHRSIFPGGNIPPGNLHFSINAPYEEMRHIMRSVGSGAHSRQHREDPSRSASFIPSSTATRWQEEARMLFGSTYIDKIQRIQMLILSKLVPFAQEEEKERRRKSAEEDERRKKEAEEAEKRREEEERVRKQEEEKEAAERAEAEAKAKAEAEAAAVAAAAAAAAIAEAENAAQTDQEAGDSEPMEGVQTNEAPADEGQEAENVNANTSEPARIFTTIRGRRLDITGLSIDLEYLEALPEDLREEVIMQQYTERRENAQEDGGDASAIDPDFLDALPEDIREEIRQHEAHNQRRRQREEARRQAQQAAGAAQAEEMDNDNFLATLDPALRRAILAEQPPEILSQLDPRHAAEGRAQQRGLYIPRMLDGREPRMDDRARREAGQKDGKRQIVQLIDKAGVATLLRLMFLPHQGSLRQNLLTILSNVCGNRQTRFEVVSLLLVILKEGSTDVTAVERSLASLSLRAKATSSQKTPQPLKRTLSMPLQVSLSEDMTPMTVVQQCLAALQALCRLGFHVKTIFLREVDVGASKSSKKGKSKESRTTKFPINDLIGLLDRRIIMDSSSCLQALAELLAQVTSPLNLLMKKEKEHGEDQKEETQEDAQAPAQAEAQTQAQTQPADNIPEALLPAVPGEDTTMIEAPSATQASHTATDEGQSVNNDEQKPVTEEVDGNQAEKKKVFETPVISEHNLRLVTSVFVAPECHKETFHATLETLSSLSYVPGTSAVFSKELVNHVQTLSHALCGDLDELLPLIKEAQSTSDIQGVTSAKFSPTSSDQVKLLRVLSALDYLSAPKKDNDVEDESATVKSILNSSYDTLSLGPLWNKLSDCLTAVREKGDTIGFANILLPLIESLMVVCKNTPLKDAPITGQAQEAVLTSPTPDAMNNLEELFFIFTSEHRKILNDIVRQTPKLMQTNGNFSLLVKNSKVLDFDNKRNYFTKQIHSRHHQRHVQPPLQLSVRREHVFLDSFKNLYFKSAEEMKHGKLNIRFLGEEGVDAGGVTREWFQVLARGMFNPDYALFQPVASDRTTFHPNPLSNINEQHLLYFKFIGRIIGKALHEGRVLDCHFSRAVYKRILGKSPNLKDLESNDVDYYKSLTWILENDITDILTEEFCVIENNFGEDKIIDLIPGGRDISVTEENKKEYVQKLVEYRLTTSVKEQLDNFLLGFHEIIPAELIAIFNEQELELLISGLPEIDVDDWKANTEYHSYSPSSPQIVWFWRIVRGMTNEERAKLLQFITGTSKVPLNGFKELEGVSGLTRHNIHKDPSTNRLPTSHTCFNQLDLPAYDSFEVMKQNLMTAINLGADYFGFA